VWCNAYSEAAGKSPAYRDSSNAILRSSSVDVENRIDAGKISDNNGFRLPTESAWLSAARSGSWTYTYAGSNNINDVAVYSGNSGNSTAEVKSKAPNDFGLYDMSGNVLEWCYDRELGYYPIFRGGSWGSSAAGCKIPMGGGGLAGGNYTDPFAMSKDRGFRVVRP
jgi:formylglycine-generating enzyme required for sulfatase activity